MSLSENVVRAARIMRAFADETGVTGGGASRRYLWTDAYAVCNFLALQKILGEADWLAIALTLVDRVHNELGRYRADDSRSGWISGADERTGARHPTAGGLRIGKPLPERLPDEPYDPQAEWDRDGQYYHYLTRWMHALLELGRTTGNAEHYRWAGELAVAAFDGFRLPGSPARLAWKMSVDLERPLLPSSGLHDPLDGLITVWVLQSAWGQSARVEGLTRISHELLAMCRGQDWRTDDPLGIGALLFDACQLAQLPDDRFGVEQQALLQAVLEAASWGVRRFVAGPGLTPPAAARLAFRELGLAIGLHGLGMLRERLSATRIPSLTTLTSFAALANQIDSFWLEPTHQQHPSWTAHLDINRVMLASSLLAPRC